MWTPPNTVVHLRERPGPDGWIREERRVPYGWRGRIEKWGLAIAMIAAAIAFYGGLAVAVGMALAHEAPAVPLPHARPAGIPFCKALPRQALPTADCIIDGDTLRWRGETIRLEGIDAPEMRGKCFEEMIGGAKAAERLRQLVEAGGFELQRSGLDRYKRTLAVLKTDRGTIGERLIAEGLARIWRGRREDWCAPPIPTPRPLETS